MLTANTDVMTRLFEFSEVSMASLSMDTVLSCLLNLELFILLMVLFYLVARDSSS